jgi:hypothetical protein
MNGKRIVGGGLVAAVIMIVGEFAIEPLFGSYMEDFLKRLGQPLPSEGAMMTFMLLLVLRSIASVWLYAAIRPRFGSGARTAALAGVVVFFLSCVFPNTAMYAFGLYETKMYVFVNTWPLVETVVATIAGARVYRETESGARAAVMTA